MEYTKKEKFLLGLLALVIIFIGVGGGILISRSVEITRSTTTTTISTDLVSSGNDGLSAKDVATGVLVGTALRSSGLFRFR